MNYRNLHPQEISQLESQHNTALDGWDKIFVSEDFSPNNLHQVTFSGENHLGCLVSRIDLDTHSDFAGIYNAHLHNCKIGDNVYIKTM
jgi:hypothetical protein